MAEKEIEQVDVNAADAVDAVFVIGTGSGNGDEELRYALRNLDRNCPFIRNVYISGECPEWVDTSVVKHLKWPDRFKHAKDANIIDKLRHACEQPGISKRILFCSDDQFVTRKCTWDDFRPRWLRRYDPNDGWYEQRNRLWHTRLHKTLDRDRRRRKSLGLNQKDVYYYQPHIWMQIDRDKFIEYAKWSDYEHRDDTIIASGYFNYIDAGGDSNFDHVFISPGQKWPVSATHVAYSDSSYVDAMKYLRETFPEESRFEKKIEIQMSQDDNDDKAEIQHISIEDINRVRKLVDSEPAWRLLSNSVLLAERMRSENYPGWQKVWKDIIYRWDQTTTAGKYIIPVTKPPSAGAQDVIDSFKKKVGIPVYTANKCNCVGEHVREEVENRSNEARSKDSYASLIDHLATAIAYLSSNACRPSSIDFALAKGEAHVAAVGLKELDCLDEYNECTKALDSVNGKQSSFNAETFRKILRKISMKEK